MLFRIFFLLLVFIVHSVISNIKHSTNKQLIPNDPQQNIQTNEISTVNNIDSREEKICTDIDVRNYVSNFEILRGCTVVEGFVQINLIDNSTYQDFANLSFPELREITEYLLFYHVSGLTSIGSLFPNLSIIRGNSLVWEYTFSVFTMKNLQEIRLPRLTHIMKGTVVIIKNPGLCFVKTIDWKKIAKKSSILMTDNKPVEECQQLSKPADCEHYWSSSVCQKENKNCHHLCAGGCNGSTANDCFVCIGVMHNGNCIEKCPPDMYIYMNRRCLTKEQCLNNKRITNENFPKGMRMSYAANTKWRPFNGSCIDECPPGYKSTADETSCVECPGTHCTKVCQGFIVKNIDGAREAKGCTYISGSVEIQIQAGDIELVAEELEKCLGMITEISGHLKLSHSLPVQSLNFLKRLRIIHGEPTLENEASIHSNYSLIVWDNPNLQELWDWSLKPNAGFGVPKFEIKKGKILFHDNPKLCIDKIYELVNITNIKFDDFDVLRESNGDAFMCGTSDLALDVLMKTDVSFLFQLNEKRKPIAQTFSDQRYVLFYVQAENGNYTSYDNVGNCESSGWKFKDISSKNRTCEVTDLEPATKYAFFVKIYQDMRLSRSNIFFQSTLPARPSVPAQFQITHVNQSSVTLTWEKPKHPHGILDKYVIKVYSQDYDVSYLDARNYCENKLVHFEPSFFISQLLRTSQLQSSRPKKCCEKEISCDLDHQTFQYVTSQQQLIQTCDNYISTYLQYNDVYKYNDIYKYKSNSKSRFESGLQNISFIKPTLSYNVSINTTSFVVTGLKHYHNIAIKISACRHSYIDYDFLRNDPLEGRCSEEAFVVARTDRNLTADTIPSDSLNFKLINSSTLLLSWTPPLDPNGMVVSYIIEYMRSESEISEMCKPRKEAEKGKVASTYFYELPSGSYKFKVRAVSLGGEGPWTDWKEWVVRSTDTPKSFYVMLVLIGLVIVFCLLGVLLFLMYTQKKNLEKRAKDGRLYASVNPEYVKVPYIADEWEVERNDVELLNVLGKGTFGIVHEGFIKSRNLKCAIKTVQVNATDRDRMEFLNEASTMKTFSSAHNIVGLLGVVSKGHPPLILIELMALGDLKTFLRNTRDSEKTPPPPSLILIKMAAQIADGMEYMEARKYVHRDLAARNCMVAEDLSVKIGDLGMSRDVYQHDYYRKGGKGLMPVRWMAPESLNDGVFTSFSDVWSYGIVLWEMTMLAEQPYQGLSNEEVFKFVISGKTLNDLCMPVYCPEVLRHIMLKAWTWRPSTRPTFHQIINMYDEEYLDEKFRSTSFHHSQESADARNAPSSSRKNYNIRSVNNEIESDIEVVQTESAVNQVVSYHKPNVFRSTSSNGEIPKES